MERSIPECPVAGIGASAGGVEACQAFFAQLGAASGVAFVVVQHLPPESPSSLPELLAARTSLPVLPVRDGLALEPNHVYVLVPDAALTIADGRLRVASPLQPALRGRVFDHFLRSLAADAGERAVAVVLSGSGSDGARGVRAIKEHGGLVMVQRELDAAHDSMPRSALATGLVDYVLPVEELPAKLVEYVERSAELERCRQPQALVEEVGVELKRITGALRRHTGHQFSGYKTGTLSRRIQRRLVMRRADSVSAYADLLERDRDEALQLFRDLLIGVTAFFRDPRAFAVLEREVLPELLAAAEGPLRVWAPGCATGEEAYSLAILLREALASRPDVARPLVFATDADDAALRVARQGRYPAAIAEQLSGERLARHFTAEREGYRVVAELREMCVFSLHDLLQDPPFSRLDLVSCRNLLIYLESDVQQRVLSIFHFALRPGGFLFLGPAEGLAQSRGLFRAVHKKERLYRRLDGGPTVPTHPFLPLRARPRREAGGESGARSPAGLAAVLDRLLLETLVPAAVVVTESGDVVHFAGRTGRYLSQPVGAPSQNALQLAPRALRPELRAALAAAARTGEEVVRPGVPLSTGAAAERVRLRVRPLRELQRESGLLLVTFEEDAAPPVRAVGGGGGGGGGEDSAVARLEQELQRSQESLRSTVAELEEANAELASSNEELVSLNEELQSANEELQSGNEELNTSKEELQLLNEELQTVNTELQAKVEELDRARDDLENLFQSTQIACLFLDRELRIQKLTPAAAEVFRLQPGDVGRVLGDFVAQFDATGLEEELREVMRGGEPRQREVQMSGSGRWHLLRMRPYRTRERVIEGVVLTFVDITEARLAQVDQARLAAIVESSQDAIVSKTLDGTLTSWNAGAERVYGWSAAEAIGQNVSLIVPPERADELATILLRIRRGEQVEAFDTVRQRRDGSRVHVSLAVSPLLGPGGRPVGASVIAHDVTARVRAEEALRRREQELADFFENAPVGLHWEDVGGVILRANRAELEMLGFTAEEYVGRPITDFHAAPEAIAEVLRRLRAGETVRGYEARMRAKDGSLRWVRLDANVLWDEGRFVHARCFSEDVTERKHLEEQIRQRAEALTAAHFHKDQFLLMLAHELRNPLAPLHNALYLLRAGSAPLGEAEPALAVAERQVQHLTRLIDDLLDVSRIQRGKILLRTEPLDLREVLRATAEDHRPVLANSGLALELDLPAEPLPVVGDRTRLAQVLANLLQNAEKFTDPGGRVTVRAAVETGSERALVTVRDTGVGIEPVMLSRIFDTFVQADRSLDHAAGGLGLGLALVRGLVELHGGEVTAASGGLGQGAEIGFLLPLQPEARPAAAAAAAPARRQARPRRVLVVEDNRDAALALQLLLRLDGHQVDVAHTGREALERVRSFLPEVVLCDVGLPEMDGYELAQELRRLPELDEVVLIALTGYGQDEDRRLSHEAGFAFHLVKPVDPEELRRLLGRLA